MVRLQCSKCLHLSKHYENALHSLEYTVLKAEPRNGLLYFTSHEIIIRADLGKIFSNQFHKKWKIKKGCWFLWMMGFNFSAWKLSCFKYFNVTEYFLCCQLFLLWIKNVSSSTLHYLLILNLIKIFFIVVGCQYLGEEGNWWKWGGAMLVFAQEIILEAICWEYYFHFRSTSLYTRRLTGALPNF